MGLGSRIAGWFRTKSNSTDTGFWDDFGSTGRSVTGIAVNQYTSLNSTAVMAAARMLAEDVAKLRWSIYRKGKDGSRTEAKDHVLYKLLKQPNNWQNGFEFREMLQLGIILRGNGYAIIQRNNRGQPVALIPWNPDRVLLWTGTNGELFYWLTAHNMHEQALLRRLAPQLVGPGSDTGSMIAFEDMLHIRGFSIDGLVGMSPITLAKEAIALSLSQEQQAARWMGQGAKPSGMLTTDQKLTKEGAARIAADVKENWTGLRNSGRVIVGEQGLKFEKFDMTSSDLEFVASRNFQLQEIARMFRIPPHMIGEMSRSTNNNIAQQAQEYINFTLTGYTDRWREKFSSTFDLYEDDLSVEFDYSDLTTADMSSRINNWRIAIMSMMATPNEARVDLGWKPLSDEGADKLHFPANMAAAGSQSTGNAPDDAGRPEGSENGSGDEPTPPK